jgi:hypothetical protein
MTAKPFFQSLCYLEDDPSNFMPYKAGMEVLLGARVNHYTNTAKVEEFVKSQPDIGSTVFILDNRIDHNERAGVELACSLRRNYADIPLIALHSGGVLPDDKAICEEDNIIVWQKSFMLLPWLALCRQEQRQLSIGEWLNIVKGDLCDDRSKDIEDNLRSICLRISLGRISTDIGRFQGLLQGEHIRSLARMHEIVGQALRPEGALPAMARR